MNSKKLQLVVDEGVPKKAVDIFDAFAKERKISYAEILYIKDTYSGIPDIKIVNHLLGDTTLFLTADRVAHNLVLKRGWRSYYLFDGKINDAALPNIILREIAEVTHKDKLYEESFLQNSAIRNLVLPCSEKQLKSLRTKRRRIRNHFGGFDRLGEVAVTVSWDRFKDQTLFGFQIQASSRNSMPAIMASENYIIDVTPQELQNHTAICYALILLLRLSLQTLPVKIYFDLKHDREKTFAEYGHLHAKYQQSFEILKNEFTQVQFAGVNKGSHILQTRKKITQLKATPDTNELVSENMALMCCKVLGTSEDAAKS